MTILIQRSLTRDIFLLWSILGALKKGTRPSHNTSVVEAQRRYSYRHLIFLVDPKLDQKHNMCTSCEVLDSRLECEWALNFLI
jgi:hypothetical protein